MKGNKFLVTNISFDRDLDDRFDGLVAHSLDSPTISLKFNVCPVEMNDNELAILLTEIGSGSLISIFNTQNIEWLMEYKQEIKEFLVERYPEKIMKDQKRFNKIFGE